jgi:membrane protein DedA with SNARE-associated domain
MLPATRRMSGKLELAAGVLAVGLIAVAWSAPVAQDASSPPTADNASDPAAPAPPVSDMAAELENSQVGRLIERFTYAAIIGVLLLCGMGLPLPEEVPILTSAILSQTGHLQPWWALGACMFGVMAGDSLMFFLGRRWGTHVLDHRLSRKLLTVERQQAIGRYFDRYGAWIIFGARFLPGIRAALFLSAGTMRVTFWTFIAMDGAAALLSIPTSFWLAYLFTDKLQELLNLREHVHFWAMGLLGAGLLIWLVVHRFWEKRHPPAGVERVATANRPRSGTDEAVDPLAEPRP